jgi:transcriptional antiterminator RfaH
MTAIASPRWYVVQTHVHSENKAAAHLLRQGYDVYLPRYMKRRRHARRVENVPAPLFPRYLFVGFDAMAARWRSIQSTQGVSSLVCNSNEPAVLPERVVAELRRREDDNGFIRLDLQPQYTPGDKVRVVDGVFGDSFGLFEGIADRDRVAILLDLLGRKVRVVLDREAVAAA